jgi:hypothetical protein
LSYANEGVDMNLLTFCFPSIVIRTDSCEFGIGGLSLASHFGWRWEIPNELLYRTSLNSLEFLGSFVGMVMEKDHGHLPELSCLLAQTGSSTGAGWLRKSNFDDADPFV